MKSLVVFLLCVTMAMGDSQYYGYALSSGYSSVYHHHHQPQQFRPIAHPLRYSPYSNYYNHQPNYYNYQQKPIPISGNSYHARGPYTYRILPQGATTSATFQPIKIPAKQPDAAAKLVVPSKKSATPVVATGSFDNKLEGDSAKGFKLLDDLVETVSQAAGTATDSDIAEVDAVKSIFADVIDEIIRQVEIKFKENNLDSSISNVFLMRSETTKKAVSEAPNQTILAAILKPYVTALKAFTAKGLQTAA